METNNKLSNLSKKPPCPGIKLLEFFKFDNLLKIDSIISPIKLENTNKVVIIIAIGIKINIWRPLFKPNNK